jgi:hypothetical protein
MTSYPEKFLLSLPHGPPRDQDSWESMCSNSVTVNFPGLGVIDPLVYHRVCIVFSDFSDFSDARQSYVRGLIRSLGDNRTYFVQAELSENLKDGMHPSTAIH